MRKRNVSTNDLKNPNDRHDLWKEGKDGYFGWLWKDYANEPKVIERLNKFAKQALKNNQRAL